jgi:hypothetical protein
VLCTRSSVGVRCSAAAIVCQWARTVTTLASDDLARYCTLNRVCPLARNACAPAIMRRGASAWRPPLLVGSAIAEERIFPYACSSTEHHAVYINRRARVRYPIVNDWACARSSTRRWRSTRGRLTGGPAQHRMSCVAQTVNLLPGSGLPAGTPESSVVNVQTVARGAHYECLSTSERSVAVFPCPCKYALKRAQAARSSRRSSCREERLKETIL